jgi:acetylornithine deacetylase
MTDVVELLRQLVSISSVSRESNRPVIAVAQCVLASYGWSCEERPYLDPAGVEKVNLIAWRGAKTKQVELALVCHTDTIPYSADWAEATTLAAHGEDLKGCGACDVKGFLACILAAASEIGPARLAKPLAIVLTADEEIGCVGVRRLVDQQAIEPKYAIVGEPTSLRPVRAGKGYCLAEIAVFGSEAHSAFPDKGVSAIYSAAKLIIEIEKIADNLKDVRAEEFSPPHTTINIGEIHGGLAKNIVPPSCEFLLEWRPIAGQDPALVPNLVQEAIAKLVEADPHFRCDLRVLRTQQGFSTAEGSRLVRALASASESLPASVAFGTEAPWLAKMGAEAVVFGPGAMLSAHSPREFVPRAELLRCVDILKTVIHDLCGMGASE